MCFFIKVFHNMLCNLGSSLDMILEGRPCSLNMFSKKQLLYLLHLSYLLVEPSRHLAKSIKDKQDGIKPIRCWECDQEVHCNIGPWYGSH